MVRYKDIDCFSIVLLDYMSRKTLTHCYIKSMHKHLNKVKTYLN